MGNFWKKLFEAGKAISGRNADLKKFFDQTAGRGKTVWPKSPVDMLKYGVRWDGVITHDDGKEYHKYQLQPNAGKIPSTLKEWRDKNGGTHAVITTMYIEKGIQPNEEVFEDSLKKSLEGI